MNGPTNPLPVMLVLRRTLHAVMAVVGFLLWVVWCALFAAIVTLTVLGHRLWPEADRGNCWSFALPRWWTQGGYLAIVPSGLWLGPVPVLHAIWVRGELSEIQATDPCARHESARSSWFGLKTIYFKFRVVTRDPRRTWRQRRNAGR